MGTIPKGKKSISITLDEQLLNIIKEDARLEMRNTSSQIAFVLNKYYNDKDYKKFTDNYS